MLAPISTLVFAKGTSMYAMVAENLRRTYSMFTKRNATRQLILSSFSFSDIAAFGYQHSRICQAVIFCFPIFSFLSI